MLETMIRCDRVGKMDLAALIANLADDAWTHLLIIEVVNEQHRDDRLDGGMFKQCYGNRESGKRGSPSRRPQCRGHSSQRGQ